MSKRLLKDHKVTAPVQVHSQTVIEPAATSALHGTKIVKESICTYSQSGKYLNSRVGVLMARQMKTKSRGSGTPPHPQ